MKDYLPFLFNKNILRDLYFLYKYSDVTPQNDNYTVTIHARRGDISVFKYGNKYISTWQIDKTGKYGPKVIDSEKESSYKLLVDERIKNIVNYLNNSFLNVTIFIVSDGYDRGLKIIEKNLKNLKITRSDFNSIQNQYSEFLIEDVCGKNITYFVGEEGDKTLETIKLIHKSHCIFYGTGSFIPAVLGFLSNPDKKIRSYSLISNVVGAISNEMKYTYNQ
jgi:hypothetical protein